MPLSQILLFYCLDPRQALIQLDVLAKDAILFVIDENEMLIGSLTDGDVRRGLIKGITIDNSVNSIIQSNPRFIKKGERDVQKIIDELMLAENTEKLKELGDSI